MCRSKALRCWSAVLMCCSQCTVASAGGPKHSQGSMQPAIQAPAQQQCKYKAATSDSFCSKLEPAYTAGKLLFEPRGHSRQPQPAAQASPQHVLAVRSGVFNWHCCIGHARRDPTAPTFLRSAMTAFTSSTAAATAEDCSPSPAGAGSRLLFLECHCRLQQGFCSPGCQLNKSCCKTRSTAVP